MPQYTHEPPPPVDVDLARVMAVGTAVWVVALVVAIVLALAGTISWVPTAVCATGAVLGVAGIGWSVRHRPR